MNISNLVQIFVLFIFIHFEKIFIVMEIWGSPFLTIASIADVYKQN